MRAWFLLAAATAVLAGFVSTPSPGRLPPIVFVSRNPVEGDARAVPGLGPAHRAVVTGGRLLVREPDGRIRPLLEPGRLFDVADPAVSFDARQVAFAGTPHPDSGWRLYRVGLDGGGLTAVTGSPGPGERGDAAAEPRVMGDRAAGAARVDDLDPCWITDSLLCFASTRGSWTSQYADVPVTNLWTVRTDGSDLARLTAERNGAEEPALDSVRGRLVYARWWYNAYRPSRIERSGITSDSARALPGERVNLWHAVELVPDSGTFRLAAGGIRSRRESMGYQPAFLADGGVVGVYAARSGLWPGSGPTGIQAFPGRYGRSVRVAGAALAEDAVDPYHDARGLAAPSACSPAGLPDGRVLFALDPGARGDFGLWCARADGSRSWPVVDLPGSLELDPAPVVRRSPPPGGAEALGIGARGAVFDFICRNVFATGPIDGPVTAAPLLGSGYRLRFFEVEPRGGPAPGDTARLIREVPVESDGSVEARALPAHVPMFEQLVDRAGAPVMTSRGAAHVAGLNFGAPNSRLQCVGCHLGHSTLPSGASAARWIDASPSAAVSASSAAPGTAGATAVADRRTRGPAREVTWMAAEEQTAWVKLDWPMLLELRELVLHPPRRDSREGTDLRVDRCEVRFLRDGSEVGRSLTGPLAPGGTRIDGGHRVVDAVEVRILAFHGRVAGRRVPALAEIETISRPR